MEQNLHLFKLGNNTREGAKWKADIKDLLLQKNSL